VAQNRVCGRGGEMKHGRVRNQGLHKAGNRPPIGELEVREFDIHELKI
jgi:hypothetical protein